MARRKSSRKSSSKYMKAWSGLTLPQLKQKAKDCGLPLKHTRKGKSHLIEQLKLDPHCSSYTTSGVRARKSRRKSSSRKSSSKSSRRSVGRPRKSN